jgi:predicted Ser/Thr protein kinase
MSIYGTSLLLIKMSGVNITKAPGQQPKLGFKRYFKLGTKSKAVKQLLTPPSSQSASPASSRIPSSNSSCINEPPTVLGSLEDRYGKPGRILGDGATGTVRVLTNPTDGTVVAVKKFRSERPLENEKTYAKKITAEFNIGSSLKHGNIIKTLEIVKECGSWFQVMEYAPTELYELAESKIMSLEEIYCAWRQILEGANYLHRMGIAHRDLKLENVVMTEDGIMKIVDFGSATVFRDPSSGNVVLARGKRFRTSSAGSQSDLE